MSNVLFLHPFIEAAREILLAEAKVESQRGTLSLHKSAFTSDQVTILFSLVGQVKGVVMYGMSIATGLTLVSKIIGKKVFEYNSLTQSGIAEFCNVVTSRAMDKLSKAGFTTTNSPPAFIQSEGVKISTLDFPRIVVPLLSELGQITIHLALREVPPGNQDQPVVFFDE